MSHVFAPRRDVLPAAQRRLWPELRRAAESGFVLYGGTAIALRLGHRSSVDFDFFGDRPLDRAAIVAALPFLSRSTAIQDQGDAWSLLVPAGSRVYFKDGDLATLTVKEKNTLIGAAKAVRDLPQAVLLSKRLTAEV